MGFQPGNVSEARRFIRMLQDDHTLRSQFGRNALKSVADKTISSVIDDLLLWYANGQLKRRSRSYVRCLIVLLNLAWAVPLCIASLGTYDLIMAVLALVGISVKTNRIKVVKDFSDDKHTLVDASSPRKK